MAKPPLSEPKLYGVAHYLAKPEVETEIHAEVPKKHQSKFENQYKIATKCYALPVGTEAPPYYILPPDANKYGRELRIYFKRVAPEPPIIRTLYTDYGKWYAKREAFRINHSALVMQLFECGFILGKNEGEGGRIRSFMRKRFPPT